MCVFQDFPGQFMSIFHVFPVLFNGMDIEQVRLSYTHAHVAHISAQNYIKQQIEPSLTVNNDNANKGQK